MPESIRIRRTEDESLLKSDLARELNAVIHQRALSQAAAASLIGTSPPKISNIRRYDLRNVSVGRLLLALTALGQEVEIRISPSSAPIDRSWQRDDPLSY